MPYLSLSKAADVKAVRRLIYLSVDGTMLPKRHNSPTISISSPSRVVRVCDEVMALHLEKIICIRHFLYAVKAKVGIQLELFA